jgi:hypothetical protein
MPGVSGQFCSGCNPLNAPHLNETSIWRRAGAPLLSMLEIIKWYGTMMAKRYTVLEMNRSLYCNT